MKTRHNRRTCRVAAIASVGPLQIRGTVVLLGRRGCLMEFISTEKVVLPPKAAMRGVPVKIKLAQFVVGATCTRADDLGLGLRFNHRLKLRKQQRILETSTISSHVAPKSKRATASAGP